MREFALATGSLEKRAAAESTDAPAAKKRQRRKTSHLKMVPEARELRDRIRLRAIEIAARLDKSRPLGKDEIEAISRRLLEEIDLPESYLGWTMVTLSSAFWRDQVAAVPHSRRLLLLPHCLKHAEGCPAEYDEFGLDCERCGACSIADFRATAEKLGYKVLVAEGSPIVMKIIISGYVDAVVGVACLNVLEKAIDKILLAGIPSMAVSLLSSDCRNTSVDTDRVAELINTPHEALQVQTRSYIHLMRAASGMFDEEELNRLAPRSRHIAQVGANGKAPERIEPIAATEAFAYDFLAKGGKHSRPFITLAAYDAVTGGKATEAGGADVVAALPDSIKRTAMAIETFHKASLVHDDIEDDDHYRYGDDTLHRKHGVATAINVGDYLIGLGYRLVSRESASLGPEVTSDILDRFAEAHTKLCEGQGAELVWRDEHRRQLKPIDALKIYALKTAPAFEAALYSGLRLAGPVDAYQKAIGQFSRNLGVAFQILNDLKDWHSDEDNKLRAAGDVLDGRPTVLWALALESLSEQDQTELLGLVESDLPVESKISRIRALYRKASVFEKADRLVDKHQERAEAVADEMEPDELRRLLYYLVDTVLERPSIEPPEVVQPVMPNGLNIVARD